MHESAILLNENMHMCLLRLQKPYVHWYDSSVDKGRVIYDSYHKIYRTLKKSQL